MAGQTLSFICVKHVYVEVDHNNTEVHLMNYVVRKYFYLD